MLDASVKFFESAQSGAPALSGAAGSLIEVLDACLVTGFGSVALDSLVIAGNVATGTKTAGHGFAMVGAAGPVIRISGATPAELNGDWRIASVPNAQTFTFVTSGISNQTATGTISAKRAPAGWEKAYSGANKAVYRAQGGNRLFLRVDDTGANDARIVGYESMADVDTGSDCFPTAGQISGGLATAHGWSGETALWRLFADPQIFYLVIWRGTPWGSGPHGSPILVFGEFKSFKAADAYATALCADNTLYPNGATGGFTLLDGVLDVRRVTARSYDGVTKSVFNTSYLPKSNSAAGYIGRSAQNAYPNPASGGLVAVPYPLWDSAPLWRGLFPGVYSPMHGALADRTIEGADDGATLFVCALNQQYGTWAQVAVDVMGPWR